MRTGSGGFRCGMMRVVGILLFCLAPAAAAPESVATALVVSVDVSQSVDDTRFRLQMEGIAEALEDPSVVGAITGNPGGILFAMVTWADRANLAVGWRRIASRTDAAATAALVRATPRQAGEFTCLGQMFRTVTAAVLPATVPLMPSGARISVPLMPRPQQNAARGAFSVSNASSRQKR